MTSNVTQPPNAGHVHHKELPDMRPDPRKADMRRHAAATAHTDAVPRKKRYASMMGVTERTARRHGNVQETKGSPLYRYFEYLEAVDDPWRIEAASKAHLMQRHLGRLSDLELVDRIHQLLERDAEGEGLDNGAKVRRGVPLAERATISERDGATDLELAACYREAEARGLTEADVFGGWS